MVENNRTPIVTTFNTPNGDPESWVHKKFLRILTQEQVDEIMREEIRVISAALEAAHRKLVTLRGNP